MGPNKIHFVFATVPAQSDPPIAARGKALMQKTLHLLSKYAVAGIRSNRMSFRALPYSASSQLRLRSSTSNVRFPKAASGKFNFRELEVGT